ncbi:MAG: amidohydrolase [Acetanaerobacterium sp.]
MDIKKIAVKYSEYQVEMRRHFHTNPEISGQEFKTSERVKKELDSIGVPWKKCGLETGVLATIKGAKPGKTILIRGDMDALTVQEETGLPYASVNGGVMHACGHDCHTSMLLTAAHILNDIKDELCGTVRLAFQPAEESAIGAKSMISEGAMDGVDGCFGIHVWSEVPSGKVSVEAGPRMASADLFKIDLTGKGGHGAAPHQCVDAAVAASAVVSNLQTVVSREISPVDPAVITVGVMQVGTRWNVVPEYAHLEGTTRCFSRDVWELFPKRMEQIITNTAKTFRVDAKFDYVRLVPPTINDNKVAALAQNAVKKVVAEDANVLNDKTTGGEDFAFFMEKAPGAIALLGVRNEACDAVYVQHSGKYQVDEDALLSGAMLYAQVAMDFNAQ